MSLRRLLEGEAKGGDVYRLASSAASVNAANICPYAAVVFNLWACNTNAAVRYVHLYDQTNAPRPGTDTPWVSIPLPVSNGVHQVPLPAGIAFHTGLGIALTTDAAGQNNAVGSGDVTALAVVYVQDFTA